MSGTMEPLPHALAEEIEVTIYVLMISTGVLAWDLLMNLSEDYKMLTRYPITGPTLVYCISRISMVGLLVTGIIVGPVRADIDCHMAAVALEVLGCIVIISGTGLFAIRVRAVYAGQTLVRAAFLILWLITAGSCSLVFFVVDASPNPGRTPSSCLILEKGISFGVIIAICALVHDTAVFLGISYRLYKCSTFTNRGTRTAMRFLFLAETDLPPLWKSIIHDGQLYYLISLLLEILVIILLPISSIGPYYRWFILPAHLVTVNTIACSVFRNVRLGKYRQDTISCRNTSGNLSTMTSLDPEQAFTTVEFHPDSATTQDSLALTNMEGENKSKDLH